MEWKVDSPEVQAAALLAALEHMRKYPPEEGWHQADIGHYKSMWMKTLEIRARDILSALNPQKMESE